MSQNEPYDEGEGRADNP